MTRSVEALFLLALWAPIGFAAAVLLASTSHLASLASSGTVLLAVLLVGPGIALYAAAALSSRAWFAWLCVAVASCFSALLCVLLVAKGGMLLPGVAVLESAAAAVALAVASGLRATARLTRRSSRPPSAAAEL